MATDSLTSSIRHLSLDSYTKKKKRCVFDVTACLLATFIASVSPVQHLAVFTFSSCAVAAVCSSLLEMQTGLGPFDLMLHTELSVPLE